MELWGDGTRQGSGGVDMVYLFSHVMAVAPSERGRELEPCADVVHWIGLSNPSLCTRLEGHRSKAPMILLAQSMGRGERCGELERPCVEAMLLTPMCGG